MWNRDGQACVESWQASRPHRLSAARNAAIGRDIATWCVAGVLAAIAVALVPLPIRIPGHAILKASLPITVGMALAPRQGAGCACGVFAALASLLFLAKQSGNLQLAAVTALLAIGPAFDVALRGIARADGRVAWRLAVAGLSANVLAFTVRWGAAWWGLEGGRRPVLEQFGGGVLLSFALCGLAAGLAGAVALARQSKKTGLTQP